MFTGSGGRYLSFRNLVNLFLKIIRYTSYPTFVIYARTTYIWNVLWKKYFKFMWCEALYKTLTIYLARLLYISFSYSGFALIRTTFRPECDRNTSIRHRFKSQSESDDVVIKKIQLDVGCCVYDDLSSSDLPAKMAISINEGPPIASSCLNLSHETTLTNNNMSWRTEISSCTRRLLCVWLSVETGTMVFLVVCLLPCCWMLFGAPADVKTCIELIRAISVLSRPTKSNT